MMRPFGPRLCRIWPPWARTCRTRCSSWGRLDAVGFGRFGSIHRNRLRERFTCIRSLWSFVEAVKLLQNQDIASVSDLDRDVAALMQRYVEKHVSLWCGRHTPTRKHLSRPASAIPADHIPALVSAVACRGISDPRFYSRSNSPPSPPQTQ